MAKVGGKKKGGGGGGGAGDKKGNAGAIDPLTAMEDRYVRINQQLIDRSEALARENAKVDARLEIEQALLDHNAKTERDRIAHESKIEQARVAAYYDDLRAKTEQIEKTRKDKYRGRDKRGVPDSVIVKVDGKKHVIKYGPNAPTRHVSESIDKLARQSIEKPKPTTARENRADKEVGKFTAEKFSHDIKPKPTPKTDPGANEKAARQEYRETVRTAFPETKNAVPKNATVAETVQAIKDKNPSATNVSIAKTGERAYDQLVTKSEIRNHIPGGKRRK